MWICAAPSRTTSQVDMPSALLIYRLGPQHSRNDSKSFHSALPAQVPVQELSDPVINPIEDLLKPPPLRDARDIPTVESFRPSPLCRRGGVLVNLLVERQRRNGGRGVRPRPSACRSRTTPFVGWPPRQRLTSRLIARSCSAGRDDGTEVGRSGCSRTATMRERPLESKECALGSDRRERKAPSSWSPLAHLEGPAQSSATSRSSSWRG